MSSEIFDVAIIGGGIVGCAVLFELSQRGYSCLLCETKPHIMSGASAGNSGMLHTGFDAPLNSLELQCIQQCQGQIFPLLQTFGIPYEKCGAYVVAWTSIEKEKLNGLLQHSNAALICNTSIVSASHLSKAEPCLKRGASEALHVPDEAIVDSNLLGVCLAHHAKQQKAKVLPNCTITGFGDRKLATSQGTIRAQVSVNCTGLYGDKVDAMAGVQSFDIKPRKGQYCVYGKECRRLLNSMIFPVPNERTKGTVLFRSVYGNILMGPTAEETSYRTQPNPDVPLHKNLAERASLLLPGLQQPVGSYVGVRPATQWKDYQIKSYPDIGWMTVGGIRSTGVSGSLGIAQYVADTLRSKFELEPSRGGTKQLQEIPWRIGSDGASVSIDGHSYNMAHPIFQFGHQREQSKL